MVLRRNVAASKDVKMEPLGEEFVSHTEQRNMSIFAATRGVTTKLLGEEFVKHMVQR
jgi:hypothetical protein